MDLQPLPGFRDFPPELAARREYIFSKWRQAAERYGFSAYDGPPLEPTDLYRRKSGDELMGQLYCFTDKGGRDVSMRPEMTPSLARMAAAHAQSFPKPLKWFAIPQLFRYERQQRGRLREHFQLNCDILGEPSAAADAELVALLVDTLRSFGLTERDFRVRVSDRPLLAALIEACGVKGEEPVRAVFAAVDKLTREPAEAVKAKMVEGGVEPDAAGRLMGLFGKKSLSDLAAEFDASPAVTARILVLQQFFGMLDAMGLGSYLELDLRIVRGLAYYTGIVFEAFDREGKLRAISGGGRYDHLVKLVGGVDMPALGFGMGDVVLGELLTEKNLWPPNLACKLDVYLVLVDEQMRPALLALAHNLRGAGFAVDYPLAAANVGKQFKAASQKGARAAVVVAPEEWQRNAVKLKNLQTREESEAAVQDLPVRLAGILHPPS